MARAERPATPATPETPPPRRAFRFRTHPRTTSNYQPAVPLVIHRYTERTAGWAAAANPRPAAPAAPAAVAAVAAAAAFNIKRKRRPFLLIEVRLLALIYVPSSARYIVTKAPPPSLSLSLFFLASFLQVARHQKDCTEHRQHSAVLICVFSF